MSVLIDEALTALKQLGDANSLQVCYKAGPTGFELYRWLLAMGISCSVIAPSLIPKRAGDHVKTDRRDVLELARLFRAGELVGVYVPSRDDEALRDLVRSREDAKLDLHRSRQRLIKFLLRHQISRPGSIKRRWTKSYLRWLDKLTFEKAPEQVAFEEYKHAVFECEERRKRLEKAIIEQASVGSHAAIIRALQALRGVALITAVTIAAEIGSFARFRSPQHLMAYTGLVPREHSSGETVRRGQITRADNSHLRRVLIEAAWSYRYRPSVKRDLRERLENQTAEIQSISWKAQNRLHEKYKSLAIKRGKQKNIAVAAVARELAGFIWAVAQQIEQC